MTAAPRLFELLDGFAPAEFHVVRRRALGLTAFIALDDLRLGPACGGIRWRDYPTPEAGAADVLRLARAMTHKNAFADIGYGGGKAVVLRDPALDPPRAFAALGEAIAGLGGRYVTACDYGTTARELAWVASRTDCVLPEEHRGAQDLATATGVLVAIRAVWRRIGAAGASPAALAPDATPAPVGAEALAGARVLVQGVGDVGMILVRLLRDAGASVSFSEIDEAKAAAAAALGATRIDAGSFASAPVDVLAPCAVGEVISEDVARTLVARGVAGAANNQLATPEAGRILAARGVWYAPDFAANAGAVVLGYETSQGRAAHALDVVRRIETRLERVLAQAEAERCTPEEAALALARARLAAAAPLV